MEPNPSREPPPSRLPEGAPLMVAQRDHDGGDCPRGYQWYTCNAGFGVPYAGCCAMDPCRPDMADCPDRYKPQLVTSITSVITITASDDTTTLTKTSFTTIASSASSEPTTSHTSTSHISSTSASESASSSASASSTATSTPDASPTVVHKDLSVGAIVGIAVGCSLAFIFFAISVCMWWGRRRAKKAEKKGIAETTNVASFLGPTDMRNPSETGQGKNMPQSGSSFPHGNYQPVPNGAPYEYRGQDLTGSRSTTNTTWPGSPMDYQNYRFSGATNMSTSASHNGGGTPVSPNFPSRGASELDTNQMYQEGGWGPTFAPMHEIPELESNERPHQQSQGPSN
ncbi:hypothetical protein B0T20DRAFT_479862 [Sordaria brevicollis]|uniref:Uncharacterized protein n=1 Tax=Sordaria brevicollis TaxID=83679 RepID=A0AAE0PCY7_SORBR|nr:hypothetical protein B0T20DRAFT_479862 [Sordaria brevicollis]